MELPLLYALPLWGAGLLFIVVLFAALESGFRVGLKRQESWKDKDPDSGGGAVVLTAMLALMGLVLAFTYSAGVGRYEARKNAVTLEANALGTAFLRADIMADPGRSKLKHVLYDYASTRIIRPEQIQSLQGREEVLARTMKQLALIWPATLDAIAQDNPSAFEVSLVTAVNAVLDAHSDRLAAAFDKLPTVIIWMLLFVSAASLSVASYNAGIQGRMSRWRMGSFVLVLASLMVVILDFDRPNDGMIIVSQNPIAATIADMKRDLGLSE